LKDFSGDPEGLGMSSVVYIQSKGGHNCSNKRLWNGSGWQWSVKTAIFKGHIETTSLRAIARKVAHGVIFGPSRNH